MDTKSVVSRPTAPPTLGIHVTRRLLNITRQDWYTQGKAQWSHASREPSDLTLPASKTKVAASLTADAGEIGA
jgi:hypothetical protein